MGLRCSAPVERRRLCGELEPRLAQIVNADHLSTRAAQRGAERVGDLVRAEEGSMSVVLAGRWLPGGAESTVRGAHSLC
jgi:hypothetical protein